METFSALLTLCAGNSPVIGESPHKGQWRGALMFSFICARINSWVNNRGGWWFEAPPHSLMRHYNENAAARNCIVHRKSVIDSSPTPHHRNHDAHGLLLCCALLLLGIVQVILKSRRRPNMETFPHYCPFVTEFTVPHKEQVTRTLHVFFDVSLNELLHEHFSCTVMIVSEGKSHESARVSRAL